jgi:hypothetical protein
MTTEKDPYLVLLDQQIKLLSGLDKDNLGCRIGAVGHRWRQVQPDWKPETKGVVAMAKQCTVCDTIVRFSVSARYGEMLSSPKYEYPDDYKLHPGGQRIRPQAVRAEWVKRMRNFELPPIVQIAHDKPVTRLD